MRTFKKIACLISLLIPFSVLVGCDSDSSGTLASDELKLSKPYTATSNFIDDGIGAATLVTATDGDTATFKLSTTSSSTNESTVRIRFYAIDTPESTGTVEKWGKAASNFTKDKLESATEIVLEATTTPASHDSYGTRYLGYVWYKTADMANFKNLNLEVVENGYSYSKSSLEDKYYSYFKSANDYASSNKLHLWSSDDDPLYNENAVEVTLKEVVDDLSSSSPTYYNAETKSGTKIRFEAYIKSHTTSSTSSPTHYYVVEDINDDGTISTFNLYGGYGSDQINNWLKVGYLYSFLGTIEYYNDSYQIAIGGTYVPLTTGDKYTNRIQKDYYCIFNSSDSLYSSDKETAIRSDATITKVESSNNILTITASAFASISDEEDGTSTTYTFTVSIDSDTDISKIVVGKTFTTVAYQSKAGSNALTISNFSDIVIK